MIVANPTILRLDNNNEFNDSKYYPLMSSDNINHIRERYHEKNIYLCGKNISYPTPFDNENIITCPMCKMAYRAFYK